MYLPTFIDFIALLQSIKKAVLFSYDLRRWSNIAILSKSKLFLKASATLGEFSGNLQLPRNFVARKVARRET